MTHKELLKITREYFNLTEKELKDTIELMKTKVLEEWKKRKSNDDYYINSKWRVFGQIAFNDDERTGTVLYPLRNVEGLDILDYGAGIGEVAMRLSKKNNVYHYDLPGYTTEFAKHLSKKSNRPITFLEKGNDIFKKQYDVIILTDVLEHLTNPIETFLKLTLLLKPNGHMLTTGLEFSIGHHIPMHLVENVNYRKVLRTLVDDLYGLIFFETTKNENLYLLKRKYE